MREARSQGANPGKDIALTLYGGFLTKSHRHTMVSHLQALNLDQDAGSHVLSPTNRPNKLPPISAEEKRSFSTKESSEKLLPRHPSTSILPPAPKGFFAPAITTPPKQREVVIKILIQDTAEAGHILQVLET